MPPGGQHRHDHLKVGQQILVDSHVIFQDLQHSSVLLDALQAWVPLQQCPRNAARSCMQHIERLQRQAAKGRGFDATRALRQAC